MLDLRTVTVLRYILPLREGGSLPALAEADDEFKYVLKFRGAGHGVKMLISELLGGKITEVLGIKIPELVFAYLDVDFGRTEADEEIQDLLKFSEGLNLGLHQYLHKSQKVSFYRKKTSVTENISYKKDGKGNPVSLDIYRPKNSSQKNLPVVIYLHGGAWVEGNKLITADNYIENTILKLVEKDFIVISANYRLVSEDDIHFPVPVEDTKRYCKMGKKKCCTISILNAENNWFLGSLCRCSSFTFISLYR